MLSLLAIILVTPFFIYRITINDHLLAISEGSIIIMFAISAWNCHRGQYNPTLTCITLPPVFIFLMVYGLHKTGILVLFWYYPVVITFYFMLTERQAWIVNIIFLAIVIPQVWLIFEFAIVIRLLASLILVSIFAAVMLRVITEQFHILDKVAITDKLTGLYNRSLLKDSIEQAIHHKHRSNTAMSMLMLDIDHFKKINDKFGHNTGDLVLESIGGLLKNHFRDTDKAFRIGGEEFLIIICNADRENSLAVANILREEIEQRSLIPNYTITVSIGVFELQPDINWKQWMKYCDDNLYHAKSNGRNQVVA